ncbi:hypothetical protein HPB49_000620 [Dermacentor silvarum]|uniref:Uncharacterized protein n=1 Tax=Dermacentor silvarum TaxID=543639 RepID=A0ACB8CIQ2_DERSI|nr:hypothetical protein HPB49_000620 [Dermacentor silvarum]
MASVERLRKNRGVVRASVTKTITLLTNELQASVPDASQLDSYISYLNQKHTELVTSTSTSLTPLTMTLTRKKSRRLPNTVLRGVPSVVLFFASLRIKRRASAIVDKFSYADSGNAPSPVYNTVTVDVPLGESVPSWIKANVNQTGFYRVNYDASNWVALMGQLQRDHQGWGAEPVGGIGAGKLPEERAGLWAMGNSVAPFA